MSSIPRSHARHCIDVAHAHIPVGFRRSVKHNVERIAVGSTYYVFMETYYERTNDILRMVHRAESGTTWTVECDVTANDDDVDTFVDYSLGLRHDRIWG